MELQFHAKPQTFLARTLPVLRANAAANNLMLGVGLIVQEDELPYGYKPFMATIERDDQLIAAGLMTPPYNLIVFCSEDDCTSAWRLLVEALQKEDWQVPGVIGDSKHARAFAETWQAITGEEYSVGMNERVFELRKVTPPRPVSGRMRRAEMDDHQLVFDWWGAFVDEAIGSYEPHPKEEDIAKRIQSGSVYLWDDHGAVSLAASTRPIGDGISVGQVYTPPEQRRKGYASAVVAALSQHLLDSGYEYCTLFTDLANPTSNAIYQRIGYRAVCDYNMFRFTKGDE